ncbi:DUF952 domain-containing protein [Nocardioides sp. AX2bis]|uniref:DUF952 domain-containing protein n=1 Tax=Nocardioides sp. AX2bis TaxID=2653157 RepID=UPI0012F25597|nr:DUF952 domain-containing protein [Nocardioides sp. AX2bis]VXB21465.1 conserved hypothetical protein [Nocardioides sp. AX2bis]
MRIFHVATAADWAAAQDSGRYTTSTRGRTLAQEGFVHAARGDQWQDVRRRYYSDVTEPLVLLVIDTDLLDAPVVEEPAVPGAAETFPHVYGAIAPSAVVSVVPLDGTTVAPPREPGPAAAPGPSFSSLFLGEVFHRVLLAGLVLAAVVVGAVVGQALAPDWGPLLGTLAGLVVGVPVAVVVGRRRDRRLDRRLADHGSR